MTSKTETHHRKKSLIILKFKNHHAIYNIYLNYSKIRIKKARYSVKIKHMKEIYIIRHAESEANIASDLDNPTHYFDARITMKGKTQAKEQYLKFKDINFDLYICSPLTRTLETFSIIFPGKKPFISDLVREQLCHSCDVGRQPKVLEKEFPNFDFSNLEEYWWNKSIPIDEGKIVRESHEDIIIRLDKFKEWLETKEIKRIAVVSHGAFLAQITGEMLDNCEHFIWKY